MNLERYLYIDIFLGYTIIKLKCKITFTAIFVRSVASDYAMLNFKYFYTIYVLQVDLADIHEWYHMKYDVDLSEAIYADTSGDYRKILLKILNP